MDQEELFVVLSGTVTFLTMDGTVTLTESETIRFASGEFQSGRNDGESLAVVLAIGAPRETENIHIPVACRSCESESLRLDFGEQLTFRCPACSSEFQPASCPSCGADDLQVTLDGAGETVVVCRGCGRTYDRPPLQN